MIHRAGLIAARRAGQTPCLRPSIIPQQLVQASSTSSNTCLAGTLRRFGGSALQVQVPISTGVGWTRFDYPAVSKIRYDVAPRTVMSPYAGGPVYQYLRNGWHQFKRRLKHFYRAEAENMDPSSAWFVGVPEQELNPTKNVWCTLVDAHAWGGPMDKVWEDFNGMVVFPVVVMSMMAYWFDRVMGENPFAIFWKWHDPEQNKTWASWFPHKTFFWF
ncbi:unnamed protein product [Amoebophrya sp. A25]|nr:unnamed protein product [Amoebophrya sp. A25]|eukprot:GSA25T00023739001.1